MRTPEAAPGKQNIDIQTDQFVTELTDKAPHYEIGCQTNFNVEEVKTPWNLPKISGKSKKTLVEDNELFLFDLESEPILGVLCGKVLETARMEVLEEEELKEMTKQQKSYTKMTDVHNKELKEMETLETIQQTAH